MKMKPIYDPISREVQILLSKARELNDRVDEVKKDATEGSMIGPSHMEVETGGRIAHRPQYWTNQSTIEVEDITNKGASKENVTMMNNPGANFPTSESTLDSHAVGDDSRPEALSKLEKQIDTLYKHL